MAAAKRISCYARAILLAGYDVKIMVYHRTERYGEEPANTVGEGNNDGVDFFYVGGTPLRSSNVMRRFIYDWYDKICSIKYLRRNIHKGDIVLGYVGTDILFINQAIRAVHRKGGKYVSDLCELPFETDPPSAFDAFKRKLISCIQFPQYDGVIAISQALVDYAKAYVRKECVITRIPILVDYDRYAVEGVPNTDDKYMFHSGTLYEQKDGFSGLVESFARASQRLDSFRFVCTGRLEKSDAADKVESIMSRYGINNKVIFTGYVDSGRLKELLQNASLVVINKPPTRQNAYCFSTKLAEYMAAGKAVVITDFGEATKWLKNGFDSLIVGCDDSEKLSETIVRLVSDSALCEYLGRNARETCRKYFDYKAYAGHFTDFFDEMNRN